LRERATLETQLNNTAQEKREKATQLELMRQENQQLRESINQQLNQSQMNQQKELKKIQEMEAYIRKLETDKD
jgi:hypothetical protein